jgi:hypothetical protein
MSIVPNNESNQSIALSESKALRDSKLDGVSQDRAIDLLDKAKSLFVALHQGVGVATTEQVAAYYEVPIESIKKISQRHSQELISDGLKVLQGDDLKEHKDTMSLCDSSARLTTWTPRAMLRCGLVLRDSLVAKEVRNVILDIAERKVSIEDLEQQFVPAPIPVVPPIKQMKEMYGINKMMHGKAYADRWMAQMQQRHYPALVGEVPQPQELTSLPTAKALLTPSQIAEQLGWKCKSANAKGFDAQGVNKKLAELGYQERIGGAWSATQKAIDLNLCDRKPVETNSRTQKDQLLWSADVLPILQEYTVV